MEPSEYLSILRRNWLLLVVAAVLGFGGGYAYAQTVPPSYRAKASVFIAVPPGATVGEDVQGSTYVQNTVPSLARLAVQPVVLEEVIEDLDLGTTAGSLAKTITVESPLDTSILEISVVSGEPERSAAIANGVADQLPESVAELMGERDADRPAIQITTTGPATAPTYAFSPNTKLLAATGMVLGLAAAVVFLLGRRIVDTRVRSVRDLRRVTDAAVLSMVRWERRDVEDRLVVRDRPQSDRAEAFRRLRTNLRFLNLRGSGRTIVVTSSLPGEGKSVTTINLAMAMAEGSSRILLVDADLRRPSVARMLGLEGAVGLTTVLIGDARLEEVVQPFGDGTLDVLAAGQIPPNPSELLDSDSMVELLREAALRYDVVLLDSAPLLPVTDAAVLARLTDGALLVVGCRKAHRHQVTEALTSLETVAARILGIVLNQVSSKESGAAYVYGSVPGGDSRPQERRRRGVRRRSGTDASRPLHAAVGRAPSRPAPLPAPVPAPAPADDPAPAALPEAVATPRFVGPSLPEALRAMEEAAGSAERPSAAWLPVAARPGEARYEETAAAGPAEAPPTTRALPTVPPSPTDPFAVARPASPAVADAAAGPGPGAPGADQGPVAGAPGGGAPVAGASPAAGGPAAGGPSAGGPPAGGPSAGGPPAGGPSAGGPPAGGPSGGGPAAGAPAAVGPAAGAPAPQGRPSPDQVPAGARQTDGTHATPATAAPAAAAPPAAAPPAPPAPTPADAPQSASPAPHDAATVPADS